MLNNILKYLVDPFDTSSKVKKIEVFGQYLEVSFQNRTRNTYVLLNSEKDFPNLHHIILSINEFIKVWAPGQKTLRLFAIDLFKEYKALKIILFEEDAMDLTDNLIPQIRSSIKYDSMTGV